jgi:hypothetical protein
MDDDEEFLAPPLVDDPVWWMINAALWEEEMRYSE